MEDAQMAREEEDSWQVVDETVQLEERFRFRPTKPPGAQVNLDENSTVIDSFLLLFSETIADKLLSTINDYARQKLAQNLPARAPLT